MLYDAASRITVRAHKNRRKRCKAKSRRSRLSSPFRIGISPLADRHRVLGCEWGFHRDRDAYIDAEGGVAMRPHEKWSSSGSRAKFSTTRALVRVVWSCGAGASPRIEGWDPSRLPFALTSADSYSWRGATGCEATGTLDIHPLSLFLCLPVLFCLPSDLETFKTIWGYLSESKCQRYGSYKAGNFAYKDARKSWEAIAYRKKEKQRETFVTLDTRYELFSHNLNS